MKEDKQEEAQTESVKKQLIHHKVEKIMGPPPENKPALGKEPKAEAAGAPELSTQSLENLKDPYPEHKPKLPENHLQKVADPDPDPELDKAIDEIASQQDGDSLLDEPDKKPRKAGHENPEHKKRSLKDRLKDFFRDSKTRRLIIIGLVLIVAAVGVMPSSRYFVLNKIGVRAGASLRVIDANTQQPLKNVEVMVGANTGHTDENGEVRMAHLKLGRTPVTIKRLAFAEETRYVTLGWGSNPLGDFKLTPVGLQYSFKVTDFLSSNPIQRAEAVSGIASAFANEKGELVLTLDSSKDQNVEITIRANGYREEKLIANASDAPNKEIKMVPSRKQAFVSKRSGKFDIYKIDADGKSEELVLRGLGAERDDLVLAAHPTKDVAAFISTRENMRNSSGYLLSTLMVIDLQTNKKVSLGRSEKFQVVGWVGDKLVYVQIAAGASANNPKRQRLISYDYVTKESVEIASSNYFNDVIAARDTIYYAPSGAYQNGVNVSLFAVDAAGNNKNVLIENETWNLFRTGYDELTIAVGEAWYEYAIGGNEKPKALNGAPANPDSRLYVDSSDKKYSVWTDERDGKGVLLVYDTEKKEDRNLASHRGLGNPLRWLNDSTVVYRVNDDNEIADYVISLHGGEAKKLTDVTDTAGVERWYYY